MSHTTPLHSLTITILLVNSFPPNSTVWTQLIFFWGEVRLQCCLNPPVPCWALSLKLKSVYCLSLRNAYGISRDICSKDLTLLTSSLTEFPHNLAGCIPSYVNQYTPIMVKGSCCWNWWLHSISRQVQDTLTSDSLFWKNKIHTNSNHKVFLKIYMSQIKLRHIRTILRLSVGLFADVCIWYISPLF